jgi:hypothetical protein
MSMKKHVVTLLFSFGSILCATDTAGMVSATKGMQLNGKPVPVAGTKSWPVDAGDVLKSDAAPVVLKMKDGSRIVLGKNSQAKLESGTVRLLDGTMQYELAQQSTLQVAVKGDVLPARTGLASTIVAPVAPAAVTSVVTTEDLPPVSRRKP